MEDTLVVFATEFGRGPFQPNPGVSGRGHHAMSLVVGLLVPASEEWFMGPVMNLANRSPTMLSPFTIFRLQSYISSGWITNVSLRHAGRN